MNLIITQLEKVIDSVMEQYTQKLAQTYNLNQSELLNFWYDCSKLKPKLKPKPKSKAKKSTGYSIFSKKIRPDTKKENPQLESTEITKIIRQKWKSLPESDRKEYELSVSSTDKPPDTDIETENSSMRVIIEEVDDILDTHKFIPPDTKVIDLDIDLDTDEIVDVIIRIEEG